MNTINIAKAIALRVQAADHRLKELRYRSADGCTNSAHDRKLRQKADHERRMADRLSQEADRLDGGR